MLGPAPVGEAWLQLSEQGLCRNKAFRQPSSNMLMASEEMESDGAGNQFPFACLSEC